MKNILITGAGSSIGLKISESLSRKNDVRLILHGSDSEPKPELKAILNQNREFQYIGLDFSRAGELSEVITPVLKEYPLSGWVNCAGVRSRRPLRSTSVDHIHDVFQINLIAFIEVLKASMKRGCYLSGYSVVQISSTSAHTGGAGIGIYAASKAAVDTVIRSYAKELAEKGVRLNSIRCAQVNSKELETLKLQSDSEVVSSRQFMGAINPENIAELTEFLLAKKSGKITGQWLDLDGGYLM